MTIPTYKTSSRNGPPLIGCMIRTGMTPGGFSNSTPTTIARRQGKPVQKHKEVLHAAQAWLEGRMARSTVVK